MSQVCGRITRSPGAPARAQIAPSSLMCVMTVLVEGCAPSNVHLLRCFQIIQGVNSTMEARPLRRGFRDACFALFHQAGSVSWHSGGRHVIRSQERISCQISNLAREGAVEEFDALRSPSFPDQAQ
jgi:hypothetical protein